MTVGIRIYKAQDILIRYIPNSHCYIRQGTRISWMVVQSTNQCVFLVVLKTSGVFPKHIHHSRTWRCIHTDEYFPCDRIDACEWYCLADQISI